MALIGSVNQTQLLPFNTAFDRPFFMGNGNTGLTLTVTRRKTGGSFGAIAGAVTELANGWYKLAGTSADSDTAGSLAFHATDGSLNIEDWCDEVSAPVMLGDKMPHGGALSVSTATLALKQAKMAGSQTDPTFWVTNTLGDAWHCESTSGGNGIVGIGGDGGFDGMYLQGGTTGGTGCEIVGPGDNTAGTALLLTGGNGGGEDFVLDRSHRILGYIAGNATPTFVGPGVQPDWTAGALAELAQGQPPTTPTVAQAIMLLYMAIRNQGTESASSRTIANDAGTVITKQTISDNGTVFTAQKLVTGP